MSTACSSIAQISEAVTLAAVIADAEAEISSQAPRRSAIAGSFSSPLSSPMAAAGRLFIERGFVWGRG
eukprot:CAMPEP_0172725380 /NCGR_PEP_ID=MMETSP1074-20121228/88254_1 /TAXON_ID=2916 /ORGANISM="Ceratium fusus, Strain PA161109" /LENGTH=67 /DNA_ID=CAMNT_0013552141 /DNA_START=44 /DNA_END=243 /DNA_ORIENTATION=-